MNASNQPLRELGIMYGRYLAQYGKPPADQEAFKQYLSAEGVKYVAERWISPRTGEPLVVLYGNRDGPVGPGGFLWMAYEETGTDGNRLVVSARGVVEEMATEQFNEMFSEEALPKVK